MKKNIVDAAKLLINRAQSDFLFSPEKDQETRFLQAFLLQSCIIEGLTKEFCNDINKGNRITGVKQPRTFLQAAREARITSGISKSIFGKLISYIDFRNDLVHKLLENQNIGDLENDINSRYGDGTDIINTLLK